MDELTELVIAISANTLLLCFVMVFCYKALCDTNKQYKEIKEALGGEH